MNFTINQTNGIRETVNSEFINKLYNLFITNRSSHTISLSGYLYSPTGYKALMDALNQLYGPDLVIEVPTVGLYILFYDPEVTNVLKTSIGDGEGISLSNIESVTSTSLLGLANNTSITDFREGCLFTGITNASTSFVSGCTNLDVLGIPPNINYFSSGMLGNSSITKVIIKNWLNWTNIRDIQGYNAFLSGYQFYDLNQDGTISIINHLILPEGCNIPLDVNMDRCIIFKNSGLQEVTLPTSMTYVGAFEGSSLKYLHFANGALPTHILSRAFSGCSSLEFNVSNLPTSITTLAYRCFYNCSKITGSINLPNLTKLEDECFKGTSITKLLDLGKVTSISGRICDGLTTLTEVTIPSTCHTLSGYGHFGGCSNLTKVNGLSNLTNIGNLAFAGTSLINNNLSELVNVTTLNKDTFSRCNIPGELNLPNLLSAKTGEFGHCKNITKVKCLNKLSSIPDGFLSMWSVPNDTLLTEVYLPKECTVIGSSGFYGCELLTTIKQYTDSIDDWIEGQTPSYGDLIGITMVYREAFRLCKSLLSINLPNVVTIDLWVFRDCIALSSINLQNVETIGHEAFVNCTSLTLIILPSTLRSISWSSFRGSSLQKLIIPEGCINIIDGLGTSANNSLKYIEISSTVTNIDIGFHRAYQSSSGNSIYLVIKATTPPRAKFYGSGETVSSNQYDVSSFAGIYVPDAALSTYQDTTNLTDNQIGWKVAAVQSKLKPISWLLRDSPIWWAEYLTRVNP